MTTRTATKPNTPVPSVSHAVTILRLLGKSGKALGVTAIARETGLSPSSAFNLVKTLTAEGLLAFDPLAKTYAIGFGAVDIARMALRGDNAMIHAARAAMQRLADRFDAAVGLWRVADQRRLLLVALAESEAATRIHMSVGQRQPWGAGSTGRVFLVDHNASEAEIRAAFAAIRWPGRISSDDFVAQVAATRAQGYAIDDQSLNTGIATVAAIIPAQDAATAYCLSASMFAGRTDGPGLDEMGQIMAQEAIKIREIGREA